MARVLVVEDDPSISGILKIFLERKGHTCANAENGFAAKVRIKQEQFDLALIDLNLGDGPDGLQIASELHEASPNTKILITSGEFYNNQMLSDEMRQAGIIGAVPKGGNLRELGDIITELLERS